MTFTGSLSRGPTTSCSFLFTSCISRSISSSAIVSSRSPCVRCCLVCVSHVLHVKRRSNPLVCAISRFFFCTRPCAQVCFFNVQRLQSGFLSRSEILLDLLDIRFDFVSFLEDLGCRHQHPSNICQLNYDILFPKTLCEKLKILFSMIHNCSYRLPQRSVGIPAIASTFFRWSVKSMGTTTSTAAESMAAATYTHSPMGSLTSHKQSSTACQQFHAPKRCWNLNTSSPFPHRATESLIMQRFLSCSFSHSS